MKKPIILFLSLPIMKNVLFIVLIMLIGFNSYSQDIITMKNSELKLKVYIVEETDDWIKYYLAEDSTKTVNQLLSIFIDDIEYAPKSIEDKIMETEQRKIFLQKSEAKMKIREGYIATEKLSPGDELQIFTRRYYTGVGLALSGVVLSTGGFLVSKDYKAVIGISVLAGILELTGLIIQLESVSHVRTAGIKLNQLGVGITIPLNK